MIRFLRKIRQKLLAESKFSKYLLYALGEIILVVIGILIALQINTWNEGRKNAANEAHILNEILNNLHEDESQIVNILERRTIAQNSVEKLLVILNSTLMDEEGLEEHVARFLTFERFYPLNNSFEMMKASGLIVKNRSLRTAISRYYDFEQKKVSQSITDIESVFLRLVQTENAIRSNLKAARTGTKKTTSTTLKNPADARFLELLETELVAFSDNNSTAINRISEFAGLNSQLIKLIEQELENPRLKRYLP